MGSGTRHNEKFTDEKIFTAGIVQEGIVLAAKEGLKWILEEEKMRDKGMDSHTDHPPS